MSVTLDATLDDGTSVIVRKRNVYESDPNMENWSVPKFINEIELLRWIRVHTNTSVASILAVGPSFSVQERMPGTTLSKLWHSFSSAAKTRFMTQYVGMVLELFQLPVPQLIGSAYFDSTGVMNIGPLITPNPTRSSSTTFNNIFEYLDFLIAVKRDVVRSMEPEEQQRAEGNLSFIEAKTRSLLQNVDDPLLLRCVFTHGDSHNENILVSTEDEITALIDWEINYMQPAILGAHYPIWLADQGTDDPQFASDNVWWEDSPAERQRVCAQFEEIAKHQDLAFYRCLTEGRTPRAVVSWLIDHQPDPGFDRMHSWAMSKLA